MVYDELNGHVMYDVTWPVAGGQRCTRLAEIADSDFFFVNSVIIIRIGNVNILSH